MKQFLKKYKTPILIAYCLLSYYLSLILTIISPNFEHRWLVFWLQTISFIVVVIFFLKEIFTKSVRLHFLQHKELIYFGIILSFAIFTRFLFLQNYPFVSVGDDLRDAGRDAVRVVNGELINFTGYGNYRGYGNIIPVLTSFSYHIFGNSILTYRVPTAIISILDILIFYLLLRIATNRLTAFVGVIVYATLPLHLFYGRTELTVAFDGFWTSSILLLFYLWLKNRSTLYTLMLGMTVGTAAMFHTPSRIIALLVAGFTIVIMLKQFLPKNRHLFIHHLLLFILFCCIGFGPMILQSTHGNFLQSERFLYENLESLQDNYFTSLRVWFSESTATRYPVDAPLFSPFLAFFFFLGIGYALFVKKHRFFFILTALVFILPFTNSAMTDSINADHRLFPLLSVGSLFIAIGITEPLRQINKKSFTLLIIGTLIFILLAQTYYFFTLFPANQNRNRDRNVTDYLSMHIISHLQTTKNLSDPQKICLIVSPEMAKKLAMLHYKQQYAYFHPNIKLQQKPDPELSDNKAFILQDDCSSANKPDAKKMKTIDCSQRKVYCPNNFLGKIEMRYQ